MKTCYEYSLEAPRRGASYGYPQHMFSWRNKKNIMWIPPLICSYVKMSCQVLISSQADYYSEWLTVQIQISWLPCWCGSTFFCKGRVYPGSAGSGLTLFNYYYLLNARYPEIFFLILHNKVCRRYSLRVPHQGTSNELLYQLFFFFFFFGELRKISIHVYPFVEKTKRKKNKQTKGLTYRYNWQQKQQWIQPVSTFFSILALF